MRKKCVFIQMIVSGLVYFMFIVAARKHFAAETTEAPNTQGCLMARDATGGSLGLCPLVHTEVKAEISGILTRVTVRQDFQNLFENPIEAVYAFPLPHNAAVDDMTIHVGRRTIRGIIKRREEARAIYEQARAQGQLAALLDQERPNVFSQQIANIIPGQNIEIVISYVETLKYENTGYRFFFPMVVGPRYIPGRPIGKEAGGWSHDTGKVPDASRITPPVTLQGTRAGHDISIEVSIDSGVPFANLRSIQHEMVVLRRDTHSALVQLADRAVIPNKDFILSYDVAGATLQDGLVTHRSGADGYFMLILQPPRSFVPEQVVPKELVFVLDTSGSMQGFPIEKAKETMMTALGGLYPHDTFNLITFSGDTRILFPQPVPATPANLAKAQALLASSYGSGGTEMMRAIQAALEPSDERDHVRIVCFMTDGLVGNDMEIISEVRKHANARVFAFGIGNSPNRFLLDKIAEEGRGAVEYVTLAGDAPSAAQRFHGRIRNPLLTDVRLEWSGVPIAEIYPRQIPDLFSAEPVVICGRYARGGNAFLRLRGRSGTDDFVRDLRIPLPEIEAHHEVLAKLWARKRIDALMAEDLAGMQSGNLRVDLREAIIELGLQHRLMTQFTSFVAVEERIVTEGGKPKRIEVPVEMPEGIRYEGVFGARVDPTRFVSPASIPKVEGVAGIAGGVVGGSVGGVSAGALSGAPPSIPLPPRPRKVEPMRIGGNVQESKLLHRVEPIVPEIASRARVSAIVMLEVSVDENGNVAEARVVRGHPLLNEAAINAVKQWKYSPTYLNGNPVPVNATVTVAFQSPGPPRPRLDQTVSTVIMRVKAGQVSDLSKDPFIQDGKAELSLTMESRSGQLMAQLRAAGFEVVSWPESSLTAIGRIAVEKLESLLEIDAVRYIAPHYPSARYDAPKGCN
jgi:Ca-activated chloride channel family protein